MEFTTTATTKYRGGVNTIHQKHVTISVYETSKSALLLSSCEASACGTGAFVFLHKCVWFCEMHCFVFFCFLILGHCVRRRRLFCFFVLLVRQNAFLGYTSSVWVVSRSGHAVVFDAELHDLS